MSKGEGENILQRQILRLETLVTTPLGRDNRRITNQRIVNTRVRHQVRLELIQIDIQRAIEPQRARDRTDDLRDQPVQVLEAGPLDVKVAPADVVHGLVVDQERAVGILDRGVRG